MRVGWGIAAALLMAAQVSGEARADALNQLVPLSDPRPAEAAGAASLPSSHEVRRGEPAGRGRRAVTIVIGGDLGLNAHGQRVEAGGARRHGAFLSWDELTAGLRPLINGDLNLGNLETVVTPRNDLRPEARSFNFRSHPAGVRHLARIGFNLLSTANNHAADYGVAGLRSTLEALDQLAADGLILAHAGVGLTREEAARPRYLTVNGAAIAFSALGIDGGGRAAADQPGLMAWRAPEDVASVIRGLGEAKADYRILSVHHGQERRVETDRDAIAKLRQQAVIAAGVDLVVGHHAHVAQGVEITDGRLIFYGLGNLLHPGMQNMNGFGMCQDYGLLARIHLAETEGGRLRMVAVEAIPIGDMHWVARPMAPQRAAERIHVLNHLAAQLDDPRSGALGLRFAPQADGSGLHCEPDADSGSGTAALCEGFSGAPPTPAPLRARIAAACGRGTPVARARNVLTSGRPPSAAIPARSPGNWLRSLFGGS